MDHLVTVIWKETSNNKLINHLPNMSFIMTYINGNISEYIWLDNLIKIESIHSKVRLFGTTA